MVPFCDFVGVNIAPVSKKTAVKCASKFVQHYIIALHWNHVQTQKCSEGKCIAQSYSIGWRISEKMNLYTLVWEIAFPGSFLG